MDKISDFLRQNPNKIAESIRPEQNAEKDEHDARCLLNARQILIEAAQLHDMAPPNHSQQEKTRALMEYKLEELTKRVDKHNNVVERTYFLEKEMEVQKEQIKVANHRISDLEGKEN